MPELFVICFGDKEVSNLITKVEINNKEIRFATFGHSDCTPAVFTGNVAIYLVLTLRHLFGEGFTKYPIEEFGLVSHANDNGGFDESN